MIDGKNEIVHYLLDRGLLEQRDVVAGHVVVAELTRRHRNYAVLRAKGSGLFVKVMQPDQSMSAQTLQKEAAFYAMLEDDAALAPMRALVPRFHSYDPDRHLLVVELIEGAEDLGALHRRLGDFPLDVAHRTGEALAAIHELSRRELVGKANVAIFPRQAPWILSFHLYPRATMQGLSGGNGELVSILQSYPDFAAALDHLRNGWRWDALIHGDMKFENCLVRDGDIRIVDWEIADIGDPAWDVGSIFQAYLTWWIATLPTGAAAADAAADSPTFPLAKIQPAMRAFWSAYAAASGAEEMLERATACAGARMLQTVYESMAYAQSMTAHAVHEVQAAINILKAPRAAAADLLGIPVGVHV